MIGLLSTGVIWVVAILATRSPPWARSIRRLSLNLGREHTILVLLLLAHHARAERAGAEDSLANPFVIETIARGGLALAALALLVPMFIPQARLANVIRGKRYGMLAIGLYYLVAALSTLWSAAPLNTAGKILEITVAFGLVWVLVMRPDAVDALKNTLKFVLFLEATLILVAIAGFLVVPSVFAEDLSRRGFFFRGTMVAPFGGPNGFSAVGAMLAAYSAAHIFQAKRGSRKAHWIGLFIMGSLSTVLSSGRQGVMIWMVGLAVVLLVFRREVFLLLVAPLSAVLILFNWNFLWGIVSRDQVAGSLTTLTGRTQLWEAGLEALWRQPLTGYGFGAGSRFVALRSIGKDYLVHIHNGFLEALLGVGIIGFLPFFYAVIRTLGWSVRLLVRRIDVPYAILLIPLLMQNVFGLGFGAWFNPNLLLFVLLVGLADAMGVRPESDGGRPRRRRVNYAR